MNCSDITRTCFICHAPDVWVNPRKDDQESYHFEYDTSYHMSKENDKSSSKDKDDSGSDNAGRSLNSSEFIHTEDERNLNAEWQKQWKDKHLINYADKEWRKQFLNSYQDGNGHLSILSRAKWLCLYGVLFENAKDYLLCIFGRHGIFGFEIEEIPTLKSLCKNSKSMLPSEGFEEVSKNYNELEDDAKRIFVEGLDSKAISYKYWDWILEK